MVNDEAARAVQQTSAKSEVAHSRAAGGGRESQHRARFDAVRQKIFGEMARTSAKWRLAWMLPYHVGVLLLLIARGAEPWRAAVQGAAIASTSVMVVLQTYRPSTRLTIVSMFNGMLSLGASVAMTGGLASPLLISVIVLLNGAAMALNEPRWLKSVWFGSFLAMATALAIASRGPLGELATPLTPVGAYSSAEYVIVALASVAFAAAGTYHWGCKLARAYERIAFELAERREELCEESEDRSRAIEGMAARLAHEVKNPLAAIKGLSVHMARSSSDPKSAERLSIVAAEADRLQAIVDGFLSFSRGLDDLKVAPTKPHQIATELATLLETRAEEVGVKLEVSGGADVTLNSDARKLRQAMLNLVLNAIQASKRGGAVKIDVSRGGACSGVKIRVSDEGAGMSAEVLERIRKPYFTTKEGGSGLGVAVARAIIEQHGGHLSFDSAVGKGTTATIDLPVCSMKFAKGALPNPFRKADEPAVEVATEAAAR